MIEGLSIIKKDRIVAAFERQNRGLSIVDFDGNGSGNFYNLLPNDLIPCQKFDGAGKDDVAALHYSDNILYVLYRRAKTVILIEFTDENWVPLEFWYYGRDIKYENPYGQAEALALDDKFVYIMTDNLVGVRSENKLATNEQFKMNPYLYIFERP